MVAITTSQLLRELRERCGRSPIVQHIEELVVDPDVLSVRIYLLPAETFISVFYNLATGKMGWHEHPFANPAQHKPCEPITFADFLARVTAHFNRAAG